MRWTTAGRGKEFAYSHQPLPRYRFPHHIDGARIDPLLRRLQSDFYEIERVADEDGADSTDAAGAEGAQTGLQGGFGGLDDFGGDLFF